MNNINIIVNSIKAVFDDISEEKISSLSVMLSEIEANNIYRKFNANSKEKIFEEDELHAKADLLSALLEIVLENPNMDEIERNKRKELLNDLYGAIATLYEQLLKQNQENEWEHLPSLVMYSMLSYLADNQTISDLVIKNYNQKLMKKQQQYLNMSVMERLEADTYYLIIIMMSNIRNNDGLLKLNSYIDRAQKTLDDAQMSELEKEDIDIQNGLKISAFGNIIYLTYTLKEYLFAGKISSEENQDIYSVIDIYSYNAFHLLGDDDISTKIIGHLLKYSYAQVAENSIWNIAEKSPKIKQFIENNLTSDNRYIYSLLPSQREVISEVLTPKKSIIVSMPTSGGKSLLAEMQILFSLHNYRTDKFQPTVCYIVPTNALIEQVKRDLQNDFKDFGFNIETALPYYDVDEIEEEILNRKHIDILISTPEKLEALIRQGHKAIENTRLVIMDEAHNIGDNSRGSKFELVLAAIKQKMKKVNFLLLSPFISNANEIGEWLADTKRDSAVISMEWTPTKQYIGCNLLKNNKETSVLEFYKSARNQLGTEDIEILLRKKPTIAKQELNHQKIDDSVKLSVILNDFIDQDGNILILCAGPDSSKKIAKELTQYFASEERLVDLSKEKKVARALEVIKLETNTEDPLLECVKYGVCYHNSGLSSMVKESIEELIREGYIKLVFATTTLAQGMNFPINTVIFNTVGFRGANSRALTNAEFWNIAGRAGRAYKDKEGYIIVSFTGSQKKTRENVKKYIQMDLEEIVSSLNNFFAEDIQINLDYNFLRQPENAPVLNLIQYISHILNMGYEYNIKPSEMGKIRTILNDSFLYHSLDKKIGFINAQSKLNNFVTQYVRHVNESRKAELEKADELGISDISYSKVKKMVGAFIMNLRSEGDNEYKASEIILQSKNTKRLAEIIDIIARIPEINIQMLGTGNLDSESIARLLLGWVNGERINDIANDIRRENQSVEDAMSLCNRYLNSQMKSYMPWGINIYQDMSYDLDTDNAKMLPSYIYYGVADRESVLLSKLGVPRFAVKNVLNVLRNRYNQIEIAVDNFDVMKKIIKQIPASQYIVGTTSGEVVKEIIDEKLK